MSLFKEMTELDELLHEPARLAIMTALSSCESADFTFLQGLTGLIKGNLSSHLAKLEDAELVYINKSFIGKIPNTNIGLMEKDLEAIEEHWKKFDAMRKKANK